MCLSGRFPEKIAPSDIPPGCDYLNEKKVANIANNINLQSGYGLGLEYWLELEYWSGLGMALATLLTRVESSHDQRNYLRGNVVYLGCVKLPSKKVQFSDLLQQHVHCWTFCCANS